MLKLIGCTAIVAGMAGGIYDWCCERVKAIHFIEDFSSFMAEGKRQTTENQRSTVNFFEEYKGRNELINQCCGLIARRLKQHYMPRGIDIWCCCWIEPMKELVLSEEGKRLVLEAGIAFFGKSTSESKYWFELYERRFVELYERERGRASEQKKIVVPVGAFVGMMLIVLLI